MGVVSVGFAALADWIQKEFANAFAGRAWLTLAVTPPGFVLLAWLCRRYFPGAQGSGIPQAMAARVLRTAEHRSRLLSLKLMAGKIVLTLLGLGCGASIGREGPTVQVGASIMLQVARWSGMGRERGLILAGGAAGVAAAFNTPLAGIVFAIEELSRTYEARTNFLVLSTVILAGLASLAIVGNYSYFGVTDAMLGGPADWLAVAACGIGGGALGGLFARLTLSGARAIRGLIAKQTLPRALAVAFACGLGVALIAIIADGATWGTGYEQARGALEGRGLAWYFAPLKLLATLLSTLAGIPGGIFAPSLAVGAGVGNLVAPWFPDAVTGAIVVLGMAGYFAGVVQAPITAFVIITEMTANHSMVIPLMVASVLGHGTSRLFNPEPLYHALATDFIKEAGRSAAD
ncbi:MAG TPA: chloride channel protein [Aliidongia sp.]|nr:chloride channel protein [Aliidongia sp.]